MKSFGRFFKCGSLVNRNGYAGSTTIKLEDVNYYTLGLSEPPDINKLDILYEVTNVNLGCSPGPFYLYVQNEHIIQVTARANGKELKMRRLSEEPIHSYDPKLIQRAVTPGFVFHCEKDCTTIVLDCKCKDESDDFTATLHISFSAGTNGYRSTMKKNGTVVYAIGDTIYHQCNTGFSFGMITFNWPKGVDKTVISLYLEGMVTCDNRSIGILNKIDEVAVTDHNQRKVVFNNLPRGNYRYVIRQYSPNGTIYSMTNYEPMIMK